MARTKQRELEFRTWGGKRRGAGRKPKGVRAGVSHLARPVLKPRFPVHVTWRFAEGVWNLRSPDTFRVLELAFLASANRFGVRLVHYSVQGNHVHLIVEAPDRVALGKGMQGLGVRIARGLNRLMGRRGRVLADHYHLHILETPTEARHAVRYVHNNARHHFGLPGPDPFAGPFLPPTTWLLRQLE
jgi:REP element-mobilizing transposase RayT